MAQFPSVRSITIFVLVIGLGAVVILTRSSWLPVVFPTRSEKDAARETDHHDDPTDRIELSEQAQRNLGLESRTLTPRPYWRTITIPGAVVDRPGESDRGVAARTEDEGWRPVQRALVSVRYITS